MNITLTDQLPKDFRAQAHLQQRTPHKRSSAASAPPPVVRPSGCGFIALLEAFRDTGSTAPAEVVARLLEERQAGNAATLNKLLSTGQVFGFEWRGSRWVPMFQFDAYDLSVLSNPQLIRAELPADWTDWSVASWFAVKNVLLAGLRPVDLLGADTGAVLDVARSVRYAQALHTLQTEPRLA